MVGYRQLFGDEPGDLRRHRLEFQHEAAGVLDRQSVFEDLHRRVGGAALDLEAAEHGDGVRRQPDMRSGRNSGVDQRAQNMRLRFAALRLDRIAQRLLHEPRGVDQSALDGVIALVRHAAERKCIGRAAADRLRMHDHHVHGRRNGARVAMGDHRQTVADHGDVNAGHFRPLRRRVIRDGHVDHLLAGLFRLADFGDGALLALASGVRCGGVLAFGLLTFGLFAHRARHRDFPCARPLRRSLIYVPYITTLLPVKRGTALGERSAARVMMD